MFGAMESEPEPLDEIVDELYRQSDARIFELLHEIANLVMKGQIDE